MERLSLLSHQSLAKLVVFFVPYRTAYPYESIKKRHRTVTLDPVAAHELEDDTDPYSDDLSPGDEAETDAELCPVCHDLLGSVYS